MQLTAFADVLVPAERRFALKLIMELLDIRGYSGIITTAGTQMVTQAAQMQTTAANTGAKAETMGAEAAMAGPPPGAIPAGGPEAAAIGAG
jgi:hypothetical protein